MAGVQKKTTSMSLTISSCSRESSSSAVIQQQRSSLVQPLRISPQRTQSPSCSQNYSGNGGVAPTFVKRLHNISTEKGQLVVLECRIRGTPPLQVSWYRENERIIDSADFRILRKKATSTSVPGKCATPSPPKAEELCTLVITEAYPEDSGIFKCTASNQFGEVYCSALLEVYTGLDDSGFTEEHAPGVSTGQEPDDFPSFLLDTAGIPPPEWPESPEEETAPPLDTSSEQQKLSEGVRGTNYSSQAQSPQEACAPTSPAEVKELSPKTPTSPQRLGDQHHSGSMSVADLPTFSPTLYPPSAFNYERPRHFIQSQPHFQAPSYESLQANGSIKTSPSSSNLSSPVSTPGPSSTSSMPASPSHAPMRSSITLIPKVTSAPPSRTSPVAFLCSVLPSQSSPQPGSSHSLTTPTSLPKLVTLQSAPPPSSSANCSAYTPTTASSSLPKPATPSQQTGTPSPFVSLPASYKGTSNSNPKPILKKTAPRPVSRSTDEEIQGSKDALIQDLEKQLRNKEARRRNSQKQSYEERMARRLLGPDNAASVFELDKHPEVQPDQPESPEGRHSGGIWSKQYSGTDGNEGSAIQEKCYAPRFLQVPQDLTVEEGRFCRIDFKVGGLPTPDVTWYLNGKAIRPDDYHKMLVCEKGLHSFIIEVVTVHHAGIYECVARNRAGESSFSMRLDVLAQEAFCCPRFVQKMKNLRVMEGDTVRLECKILASPAPQLYWKKDKEMLSLNPSRMSLYQDNTGQLCLLIDQVEKTDAGWYTVSAINEAGMASCNARLDVGTRLNKVAPAGQHVKLRPVTSQLSSLSVDGTQRQPAPLYESEEL
ncbi:myotilin isoform X1 [Paramormyrops kingsleyae]|uniref:Myotilin n=1 Tax=Paramormyrops kingsleyae TaxID=1676925 RepID=A0A3B3QBW5_9TELE|nr:myotilin isoform X1 [Paramormyrops kingsleyae]